MLRAGHSQPCDSSGCHVPWIDNQLDWLNELGLDAMVLQMPGYQCNYDQPEAGWIPGKEKEPGRAQASHWGGGCNHSWWQGLEDQARTALLRSWVVLQEPSQTRMRHAAC